MLKSQVGTIVAVFYLVYGFLQVAGGVAVDKWKPEHFITIGFLGAGLCNLAVYLCEHYRFADFYYFVLIVWVLNACVQFAVWPATFKMTASMVKKEQRTNALFLIAFANPFGTVLNYLVAALIPKWQYNFLLSAVGLVAFALIWEFFFRGVKQHLTEEEIAPVSVSVADQGDKHAPNTIALFLASGVALLLIVILVRSVFDNGLKTLIATMINESYPDVTPTIATALTIVILIAGALGPMVARWLYPAHIKSEMNALAIFMLLAFPFACLMLLLGRAHYVLIVVFTSLVVLATSAASLSSSYIAARFHKWGKTGTVAGALNAVTSLGIVVSNFVFTRVAERFNWIVTIEIWLALLVLSYLLLLIILPMWRRFFKQCEI